MGKLEKQNTFFVNYKTLKGIYVTNRRIDYSTFGVELGQKIALNKFLFSETKVIKKPFALLVDKSTINLNKTVIIDYISEEMIIKNKQRGKRDRTIAADIGNLTSFIVWSDNNNINFWENITFAQQAFAHYTLQLKYEIRVGASNGTASYKQRAALKILQSIHNDKKNIIASGIKLISRGKAKSTQKSSDEDRDYQFNFYFKLFHEIADFLLQGKRYPHKLKLYDGDMWIVPQRPIFLWGKEYTLNTFDHFNGKIRTAEEMNNRFSYADIKSATTQRRSVINRLRYTNLNLKAKERLELGSVGLKAFYMVFIALTGMNDSVAATLPWKDEYQLEKEQHKFVNIKYRAEGNKVEFELQKTFIKSFQKYIKLREYILNGHKCKYLFFKNHSERAYLSLIQKRGNFVKDINNYMIKKIDPNLPRINAREMRVNKVYKIAQQHGIVAAANMSQSSLQTCVSSYSGESEESSSLQMSKYFSELNKTVICDKDEGVDTCVGQCMDVDMPKPIIEIEGISIDCKQPEGCLFCEKYGCHSDEIDLRKLFSLEFIIEETRSLAKNNDHFLSLFKPVLDRINVIVDDIRKTKNISEYLIEKIKIDVFENENLHPYWEHKLAFLIDVGLIK